MIEMMPAIVVGLLVFAFVVGVMAWSRKKLIEPPRYIKDPAAWKKNVETRWSE